jgi:L-asparaginase
MVNIQTSTLQSIAQTNNETTAATSSRSNNNAMTLPTGGPGGASVMTTGSKNRRLKLFEDRIILPTPFKNNKARTNIAYIATGGTISAEGTDHTYTAGARTAADLLGPIKKPHNVRIEASDAFSIDSKDIEAKHWIQLRDKVLAKLHDTDNPVDSIVITHGSDTLALSAFFLSLTLDPAEIGNRTIVFTGSMKPANSNDADGPDNLSNAFYLAKSRKAQGVVCVMDKEIFSPPYFDKKHTESKDAFKPVNGKRIGKINGDNQKIKHPPAPVPRTFDLTDVKELPMVRKITAEPTATVEALKKDIWNALLLDGAKAIVYAGTGNGTIHAEIEQELKTIANFIPVIRSTKVGDGEVTRNGAVQDDEAGFICSGKLIPDMACMLAKVAIAEAEKDGKTMDTATLNKIFEEYQSPEYIPDAASQTGVGGSPDSLDKVLDLKGKANMNQLPKFYFEKKDENIESSSSKK